MTTLKGLGDWVNVTTGSMSSLVKSDSVDLKVYRCIRDAKNRNSSVIANVFPRQSLFPVVNEFKVILDYFDQ